MTAPEGGTDSPERILRYGPHDDQYIEVTHPRGPRRGTAVLIHGGYWRTAFAADLMHPLVPLFTAHGWTVANIEYRRGTDAWAATHEDLHAALSLARTVNPPTRLAIIGHSVGGQLALLGSRAGDTVVALAPVTDVIRGYHERIGNGAVAEFFGDSPETRPELYAHASPLAQLPPRGEVLLVHGCDDARVPIAHTRDYGAAARAQGGDVEFLQLSTLSHLDAIDPGSSHWKDVHAWLDHRLSAPADVRSMP